jgi:hypothetical protein
MARKTLVLLGSLSLVDLVTLRALAGMIILTILLAFVIVFIALFNQKVLDRLIKLITTMAFLLKARASSKKN